MRWGLVPSVKAGTPPDHWRMFNARSETVDTLQVFSRLLDTRRCAVPLDGFYEWKDDEFKQVKSKQPYYVHRLTGGTVWVAGLCTECVDETGRRFETFTLITREVVPQLSWLHDRQPAMLDEKGLRIWLSPATGEKPLSALGEHSLPADELGWCAVTKKLSRLDYQG